MKVITSDEHSFIAYNLMSKKQLRAFIQWFAFTKKNNNVAWTPSDDFLQTLYRLSNSVAAIGFNTKGRLVL